MKSEILKKKIRKVYNNGKLATFKARNKRNNIRWVSCSVYDDHTQTIFMGEAGEKRSEKSLITANHPSTTRTRGADFLGKAAECSR